MSATSKSFYSKDQFGVAHVHGAISGTFGWATAVATLPAGYRPSVYMEFAATFSNASGSVSGAVAILADGTIKAFPLPIGASGTVVYFDALFVTA